MKSMLMKPVSASAQLKRMVPSNPSMRPRHVLFSAANAAPITTSPAEPVDAPPASPVASSSETTPVAVPAKDDVQGEMLEPSVANNQVVRSLAVMAAVAVAAYTTSSFLPSRLTAFFHVLAFGVMFGTNLWNSFFVGLTMFKNMPRQMFGRVQSKLFPQYFALTTGAAVVAVITLMMGPGVAAAGSAVTTLAVALATNTLNWLVLEPKATALMFQRYDIENKVEKTEEDKARVQVLYKEFGKLHGISSMINLLVFCCSCAHGWYLAGFLSL